MAADRQSHMVVTPSGFLVLRIFQLIFAFIVLGINIYGAIYVATAGIILNIFTSVATIITILYIFIGTYGSPIIYQYWAILSLEIFCLIFWLVSFALLAAEVAFGAAVSCGSSSYYDYYSSYYGSYTTSCTTADVFAIGLFGGAAGVGGVEFIFFIISLSMFGVAINKHRKAGGHCKPGSVATPPQENNPNQNYGAEKVNVRPQSHAYPVQGGYFVPVNPNGVPYQQMPMQMPPQMYQQMPQQMPQQMHQQMPPQMHQQLPQQMPQQMPAQLSADPTPQGSPHQYPAQHGPMQYNQQQSIPQ